jgi:hypothetical protein
MALGKVAAGDIGEARRWLEIGRGLNERELTLTLAEQELAKAASQAATPDSPPRNPTP